MLGLQFKVRRLLECYPGLGAVPVNVLEPLHKVFIVFEERSIEPEICVTCCSCRRLDIRGKATSVYRSTRDRGRVVMFVALLVAVP